MDAGRREEIVLLGGRESALGVAQIAANGDRGRDAGGSHAIDRGGAIGVESFVVQVRVRVEEVRH